MNTTNNDVYEEEIIVEETIESGNNGVSGVIKNAADGAVKAKADEIRDEVHGNSTDNTDHNEAVEGMDIVLACLSYIHILFIFAILLRPESKFCQLHGKQGMIIFLFFFIILSAIRIFSMVNALVYLYNIIWFIWVILALVGIIMALQSRYFKFPVIGYLADKINFSSKNKG